MLCVFSVDAQLYKGSVYCKSAKCSYADGVIDKNGSTAYGQYNDTLLTTGWGILDISAGYGEKTKNYDIMFGAGLLEGIFTAERIYQHYQNIHSVFFSKSSSTVENKVRKWLAEQDIWMRKMIQKNDHDPFWRHLGYIMAQFDGLVEGYNVTMGKDKALDVFAFQVLNGAGDIIDLMHAVAPETFPDWSKMTKSEAMDYIVHRGHCSALVKVMGAFENIFMSHSSWFSYAATMRIYKHYSFNVDDPNTAAKRMSFSSYPGFLESLDDFYLLGSQMVMLQTTNSIFNKELYKHVKPDSVLAWQRVRTANMMANSGKDWASTMGKFNSGTYNNQYMVVDLKKITLGEAIMDGALWVVEQIPTLVKSGDLTSILRTGYWPSYNVPFFEEIYNKSGYPQFTARFGKENTYQMAPRATIFRRDEADVNDLDSMKHIMRYNDYTKDPYSDKNPCNTICCRGDLNTQNPRPDGCYDTKDRSFSVETAPVWASFCSNQWSTTGSSKAMVSDFNMALAFTADVINGPTLGDNLPPFKWTSAFNVSHIGLPDTYNFKFIRTSPLYSD